MSGLVNMTPEVPRPGLLQAFRPTPKTVELDGWLLVAAGGLAAIGMVMVTSSSMAIAVGLEVSPFHYAIRHLIALGLGLMLATWLYFMPLARLERASIWLIWAALLLLMLPWLPMLGVRINGALRWIRLGITNFQVVEAAKLLLLIYLAGYCVRHKAQLAETWKGILKPLGMVSLVVLLLLVQPDFGSAVLLMTVSITLLWLAGARASFLMLIAVCGVVAMSGILVLEPYRLQRVVGFLDPWADPYKTGFQLTQALIAVGRGEWFGVGLGDSVQKLFYLPEAHSDFIVAVIAEELGFVGLAAVIALFALFAGRAFELGSRALELGLPFAGYLAHGIALWFSFQALVSIGVNLGVLPTKGLTLPLISSGGSSIMMSMAAVGLLMNVSAVVLARAAETKP